MKPRGHILVTTLGTTWAIVPEVYGIFTGMYGNKPYAKELPTAPDTVWIVTTASAWEKAQTPLEDWAKGVQTRLRIFQTPEADLTDEADIARMRELIFRVVLLARTQAEQLSCSLAGGRKTMSADMQEAARLFGCERLLHVISNGVPQDWPGYLRSPTPESFLHPLPTEALSWIVPVMLAGNPRADFLDVLWQGHPPVHSERFPAEEWLKAGGANALCPEIEGRRRDTGLLSNYIAAIERDERHENWRSLYRLPPRQIERLRTTRVGPQHAEFLRRLPKAELHCHIGGILDLTSQRLVARQIWQDLSKAEKESALKRSGEINWQDPQASWRDQLKRGNRAANVAAVFQAYDDDFLESILFPANQERTALKSNHPLGFAAYELPGELSGSAVLGHPAAIEPTVRGVLDYCKRENIRYLELRGSPYKYAGMRSRDWLRELRAAFQRYNQDHTWVRFVWIADRRQPQVLEALIKDAATAYAEMDDFLVGIDLAGDEGFNQPESLTDAFLPAFEACLPITIHAGEGESADNIWQAAYHLHADRIGHGLTLAAHPQLLTRFRNRGICLELCPTSNREVVGFRDPAYPQSQSCPVYPLRELWDAAVPLTLCTDNPGISRCTPTGEYLAAARMLEASGGLTLWEAMAMMKRGFVHAFADAQTRSHLLKTADREIAQCLQDIDPLDNSNQHAYNP